MLCSVNHLHPLHLGNGTLLTFSQHTEIQPGYSGLYSISECNSWVLQSACTWLEQLVPRNQVALTRECGDAGTYLQDTWALPPIKMPPSRKTNTNAGKEQSLFFFVRCGC